MAPMLPSMDWLLSFSSTSRSAFPIPALFRPSNASPPVIAPSPISATTFSSRPMILAAHAKPRAAEIEVDECPVPKQSYSLSLRLGKPLIPPSVRSVLKASRRPVRILCAYA